MTTPDFPSGICDWCGCACPCACDCGSCCGTPWPWATESERDKQPDVQSPMSRRRDLDSEVAENAGSSPVGESS